MLVHWYRMTYSDSAYINVLHCKACREIADYDMSQTQKTILVALLMIVIFGYRLYSRQQRLAIPRRERMRQERLKEQQKQAQASSAAKDKNT